MRIGYQQIGTIYSDFKCLDGMPIQPVSKNSSNGIVKINVEYKDALVDIDGFSHIILLYHFHKANNVKLKVKPYMDDMEHGIFSTRAPLRPNPIGISIVRLIKIEDLTLFCDQIDILNNTPLLDIKPFFEKFDNRFNTKQGWLKNKQHIYKTKSDKRFIK